MSASQGIGVNDLTPASWRKRLDTALWQARPQRLPPWRWRGLRAARVLYVLIRDLLSGELTLRAMGLVYTTLVSLVPLLAVSFSVLKAFGVHNQLEPTLAAFLAPLGARGDEITRRIMEFIDNVYVGVLGAAGLGLLIYTVVSVMQKIEESFNFIWHVSQPRGFGERFSRYLSDLPFAKATQAVEVPEQLVCAVDNVNDHARTSYCGRTPISSSIFLTSVYSSLATSANSSGPMKSRFNSTFCMVLAISLPFSSTTFLKAR